MLTLFINLELEKSKITKEEKAMLWILTFLAAYLTIPLIRPLFFFLTKSTDDDVAKWYQDRPHLVWGRWIWKQFQAQKAGEDGITGLCILAYALGLVFWVFMLGGFLTGFQKPPMFNPELIPAAAFGICIYSVLEILAFIRRSSWVKNNLKLLENTVSPAEIKEAKKISKKLLKMLKGKRHREQFKAVAARLEKLVKEEMPRLLENESLLVKLVADAEATIKLEKDNGIIEGEKQLMSDSEKDLETLKKRLEDTKNKIQLIICFLNHFSIRLSVLVSADTSEEVERSLFEVQQDLDQMLRADEEIAGLHAKYVRQEIAAQEAAVAEVNQVTEKLRQPPKVAAG